ncbi:MAG: autophagy protein atg9 [Vezdaea aestivalis]|nr:MAG: autophagy protein atg9 [Vezdaea aestivalis]
MTSNFFSRLLPPSATDSPSIYETLQQEERLSETPDIEHQAMRRTGTQAAAEYHDYDAVAEDASDGGDSQLEAESTASLLRRDLEEGATGNLATPHKPRWMATSAALQDALDQDYGDDEVPASLLVEGAVPRPVRQVSPRPQAEIELANDPLPGPSTRANVARWQTTMGQQPIHSDETFAPRRTQVASMIPLRALSRKQLAEQRWEDVINLDNFLKEVYDYFLGNGIWSILLARLLNVLTVTFVIAFTAFLSACVDYKKIPVSKRLPEVLVPQCTKKMSGSLNFALWIVSFSIVLRIFQMIWEFRKLRQMHDFYLYLLHVPDAELQTISWQEVVRRLMELRDKNPTTATIPPSHQRFILGTQSKQRMDAHDIANRIMRKENFFIALFNKDVLDLTLPIPFLRNRQLFSNVLQWNLSFCILDYVFNEEGQVRPLFTRSSHRRALSDALRQRFLFAGYMNIICAPFIIVYLVAHYFLRYFTEYQKNPASIGSRQYTPLAEWKFREFNELWHLYQRRVNMSYPFASRYVDQFPKDKTVQTMRFVGFIAGALASVLVVASALDPEIFIGFEVTPERTVLFYVGLFGTIFAVCRGAVPDETLVFDPEFALRDVIEYTHYCPTHWKDRLHTDEVKREFSFLYQMKIVIFFEEILGLVFTPFILWFSLPKCSDRLVDFFREFTIDVDGLGKICSFAEFDFQKEGQKITQAKPRQNTNNQALREDYFAANDSKMLHSYYNFLDNYATNPKPGAPYMYHPTRRSYQPFHNSNPEIPDSNPRSQSRLSPRKGLAPSRGINSVTTSGARGSRVVQPSPMPSILLDPHHQPSATGFRRMVATQSRTAASLSKRTPTDLKEASSLSEAPTSAGNEESLGGSWKTTRAAQDEDSEEEPVAGKDGEGVLGLLRQMQKTTPGPRTGTLNI